MATVVVFVLRDRTGIHPASAVSLCVARDLADRRGAAVTALAMGDAGDLDHVVTREVARRGADQLLFVGPADLTSLAHRVVPRKVLVPNTPEGRDVLDRLGLDVSETASLVVATAQQSETAGTLREVGLLVTAGTLPWHDCPDAIEPDYGGAFEEGIPCPWVTEAGEMESPRRLVALEHDTGLDASAMTELGVETVTAEVIADLHDATLIASPAAVADHDATLRARHRSLKLVLVDAHPPPAGPAPELAVDFALVGPSARVLGALKETSWRAALA